MNKVWFPWIIIMTNTHELQLSMFYRITIYPGGVKTYRDFLSQLFIDTLYNHQHVHVLQVSMFIRLYWQYCLYDNLSCSSTHRHTPLNSSTQHLVKWYYLNLVMLNSDKSMSQGLSNIKLAIANPVAGPLSIPQQPCPVAIKAPL